MKYLPFSFTLLLMKRTLLVGFLSLAFIGTGQTQIKFEFEEVCGSPAVESQIHARRSGTVIDIIDGDTIKIKDNRGKKWTVELAGADSSRNNAQNTQIITKKILGKDVTFIGNPKKEKRKLVEAIVRYDGTEINRFLIENGLASYRNTEYDYAVSNYTLCVYDKLETQAKSKKLGIWAAQ